MELKEAVMKAKEYVSDIFADEQPTNIGLEEVSRDQADSWTITIGFSRPWDNAGTAMAIIAGKPVSHRTYKVLQITDEGKVLSLQNRNFS